MNRKFHEDQAMSDLMLDIFLRSLEGSANHHNHMVYPDTIVRNAWRIAQDAIKKIEIETIGFRNSPDRLLT